jgi:3-oxoacyl-ACP reductase-like protein
VENHDAIVTSPALVTAPIIISVSPGPFADVANEPLTAVETLAVLVAHGLRKILDELPLSKTNALGRWEIIFSK